MHKLAKGLKKKKKQKKGKKGVEEEEFEPEELERYRRERAEAQQKLSEEHSETGTGSSTSDEWKKFEALTAGVDSILKKTQGDLDRIKTTSFFQRKAPVDETRSKTQQTAEPNKNQSKKWVGFDKAGNSFAEDQEDQVAEGAQVVNEGGFVNVSDYDDEPNDSSDEDIFDTTYVDVLQNTDVKLAYIPDSPTEEKEGDDPFDTSSAEKVLKTVDKKGKKLVSLGNAVEVLAGRIDHVSTCKLRVAEKQKHQDLLLDDDIVLEASKIVNDTNLLETNKTLLDDDSDLPEVVAEINLTSLPIVPSSVEVEDSSKKSEIRLDISEFETFKESTILEEIPDLDDSEFDFNTPGEKIVLEESEDPFSAKELPTAEFQNEIVEASFEGAIFINEEDPFDTTFAENILPGKAELKFIEKELQELPESAVSISLTDPAGLIRDYETGLLKDEATSLESDLLAGSTTDLSHLAEQPIQPVAELSYSDPFDTSCVQEIAPGKTELKFLEQELLDGSSGIHESLEDDDFDPRKGDTPCQVVTTDINQPSPKDFIYGRKTSRPEILEVAPSKVVAFELPTSSNRPDLLSSSKEEKAQSSKPLTPYYCQQSLEECFPLESDTEQELDPFDTSFVTKVAPSKTELKLIESELLKTETSVPATVIQTSIEDSKEESIVKKPESILDSAIKVDIKPLTPSVESKLIEEEEILYADPFDTSIATNILPGKAELKLLENELSQVSEQVQVRLIPINLVQVPINSISENESQDFLSLDGKELGDKILTPLQDQKFLEEEIDPFDTSFATVELGKTELKLLESELINK